MRKCGPAPVQLNVTETTRWGIPRWSTTGQRSTPNQGLTQLRVDGESQQPRLVVRFGACWGRLPSAFPLGNYKADKYALHEGCQLSIFIF